MEEEEEVNKTFEEVSKHGLLEVEQDVGKLSALPVIDNSTDGFVYDVQEDVNQYVYNTKINFQKRVKSIGAWRSKTSNEILVKNMWKK